MSATTTLPYQFSLLTGRAPDQILGDLNDTGIGGVGVVERGDSYVVLRPASRYRFTTDMAVAAGIGILLVTLILTAITPVFIVLLPLALLPALPSYFDKRPAVAVAAVVDAEGTATRVTVHGEASPALITALDAYLGALPGADPPSVGPAAESSPPSAKD